MNSHDLVSLVDGLRPSRTETEPPVSNMKLMSASRAEDDSRYGPPPQYPIESVDNALRLLLLFETRPSIRLTDASKYLGVASSTAHRLMGMLLYRVSYGRTLRPKRTNPDKHSAPSPSPYGATSTSER